MHYKAFVRLAGAERIIGVDPLENKRASAAFFAATHTAASMEEAQALVSELTRGAMADSRFSRLASHTVTLSPL